jgi:hypothetical protein
MYLLSEEMRDELLNTFKYARDKALQNKDEDSASYYWGLVDYLQGLPKFDKTKSKSTSSNDIVLLPKSPDPIPLNELRDILHEDSSLTPSEKFELYYEERENQRESSGLTLNKMLKNLKIKKSS